MNSDTLTGQTRDFAGKLKEGAGDALGDRSLQREGIDDQFSGKLQEGIGHARDAVSDLAGPMIDQLTAFARKHPFASATLGGVLLIAVMNTLRGK